MYVTSTESFNCLCVVFAKVSCTKKETLNWVSATMTPIVSRITAVVSLLSRLDAMRYRKTFLIFAARVLIYSGRVQTARVVLSVAKMRTNEPQEELASRCKTTEV